MTRILVVDDEESIRNLVEGYLSAEGYIVTVAEDGWIRGLTAYSTESDAYVLMLTANAEETDRVIGLTPAYLGR